MKKMLLIVMFLVFPSMAFSAELSLDGIIKKIEERYKNKTFSAYFLQTSVLKAMDLTDNASGKVIFKYPDKMFWEYEKPEKQKIIFNGKTLWIYTKSDNQVIVGDGASFFKDGKGASFLTNIDKIKENFKVSIIERRENSYKLKLVPIDKTPDISYIEIVVLKRNFDIIRTAFFNSFEDENVIIFSSIEFLKNIDESIFDFSPPKGADILEMGS